MNTTYHPEDWSLFGYTWKEIQRAQQGGPFRKVDLTLPAGRGADPPDLEMLDTLGVSGLAQKKLWGVLDRLRVSGFISDKEWGDALAGNNHA